MAPFKTSRRCTHTLPRPLMGYVVKPVFRIYLADRASINSHREHDPLKPSLYFIVDLIDGHADERSGQIAEQLLEIHCRVRLVGTATSMLAAGAA